MTALLPKLNLGTLALALLLFLLPWTNVTCAGRTLATQSGLQKTYGGYSATGEMKEAQAMAGALDDSESPEKPAKKGPGMSVTALLALLLILGGVAAAGLAAFTPAKSPVRPGILAAAALLLLLIGGIGGFPIDREVAKESRSSDAPTPRRRPPGRSGEPTVATERTAWFYLELLALAGCVGLLVYEQMGIARPTRGEPTPPMPGQTSLS